MIKKFAPHNTHLSSSILRTETWIFDLDNTLYSATSELFSQIDWNITRFVAKFLNIEETAARTIQKDYFRRYGTTMRGLMNLHDVDPQEFLEYVHNIDLSPIANDPKLILALDKIHNQEIKQAIIVVPERSIGSSFHNEPLKKFGFFEDWSVVPKWNLCDAPGTDGGKVNAVKEFLDSNDSVLITTHATFRFAVDKFGVEVFDDRLIAIDEFHHVSANPDNKLGVHLGEFLSRDRVHIIAMTGSYFRGDAEAVLTPSDESKFENVTYTYYEQLNGYEHLKKLDIGYFFYTGTYADDILKVLNPFEKTIIHIPSVNSRESTKDKIREVEHILEELGEWEGTDPDTGFQLVKCSNGEILRIADLVDDDLNKRERVVSALKDPNQKKNKDHVDIIIALGMAKEGFDWIWCEHSLTVGYRAIIFS